MQRTLLLAMGFLLSSHAAGAAPLVIPDLAVQVVDLESGQPLSGVDVAVLVKAKKRDDYERLASGSTGGDGTARFSAAEVDKLSHFAVEVSWSEVERPRRAVVYEVNAKKGDKTSRGRMAEPGKTRAYYDLAGELEGDCENLFSLGARSEALELRFRKPGDYAACQEAHFKHADVGNVGQRNINAGARNLYSFDKDVSMGRDFTDRMGPDQPALDDPVVRQYVVDLVGRIGRASDMPDLDYHVQVIDADVLNAFALPGGYVFVYRGLIEATENESELVGVLAHEIAHVTGRHGTEGVTSAMAKMYTTAILGGLLVKEVTDDRATQELIMGAAMAGTNLWVMGGTRKREAEADRLGAQYALRAGYDPRGLGTFFEKLSAGREHKGSRIDKYFSDHPPDDERVASVGEMVDYFLPRRDGLITSSPDYEAVKQRLARMPAPKMAGEPAADALFSSFKAANEDLIWGEFKQYVASQEEEEKGDGG